MNNDTAFSAFFSSQKNSHDLALEAGLDDGMKSGADVFQLYAAYEDLAPEDMASLFECDVKTYNDHVSRMPGHTGPSLSPLTAEHVLNFCYKVRLHPAELTLSSREPEHACPPNIYKALHEVCVGDYPARDREVAAMAMEYEAERCKALLARDPISAKIFDKLYFYTSQRKNEHLTHEKMMSDIRSLKEDPLKKVLLKAFNDNGKLGLFESEHHILDYGLKQHADLQTLEMRYHFDSIKVREFKNNIKLVIGAVFGKHNTPQVMDQAERLAEYISDDPEISPDEYPSELDTHLNIKFKREGDALKALAAVGIHCNNVSMAIREVSKGYFTFREMDSEVRLLGNKVASVRSDVKEFDQWAGALNMPEFSFVQYIYSNNALAVQPVRSKDMAPRYAGPSSS